MTERELRRLSKTDLLTILRDQQAELEALAGEKEELRLKLQDRSIDLEKSGSIAEAALAMSGVFQAAQRAADQYLESIRAREGDIEQKLLQREEAADRELQERRRQTESACRAMEADARAKSEQFWTELEQRLDRYYTSHEGLKEMLRAAGSDVAIPANRPGPGGERREEKPGAL